jgi:uncharacterized membrane protein YgcG
MTKLGAMTVGMIVAGLMVPGIVHAQNVIVIQGTIQAADCQANTLALKAADGSTRVFSAASSTAVFVDSAAASLCTLPRYVGSSATVWITASGDQLLAGRVDVSVAAPVIPESVPGYGTGAYNGPYYGPYYGPYFYPFFGVGIDVDPGFRDRDFRRDRDFDRDRDFRHDRNFRDDRDSHRDRDFHGGDRGGTRGGGNGGFHGGGMNGGSQGGGMTGGSHGGGHGGGRH